MGSQFKINQYPKRKVASKDDALRKQIVAVLDDNPDGMSFTAILLACLSKSERAAYKKINNKRGSVLHRLDILVKNQLVLKDEGEKSIIYKAK